jgi:hypothetical protein
MMECEQDTGACGHHRRDCVGNLFVAVGCVTDELRALLVFADGDQYGADRRAMKTSSAYTAQADRRHHRVVNPGFEVDAEPGGASRRPVRFRRR